MNEDAQKPRDAHAKTLALLPTAPLAVLRAQLEAMVEPYLQDKLALYTNVAELAGKLKATDADSLQRVTDMSRELALEFDGLEAVRKAGPGAFDAIARTLNAKFKPLRDKLEEAIGTCKAEIGGYVVGQRAQQTENYQAAAVAHAQGDHAEAQLALSVASEADTGAPKGTSVREVWEVERYALDLMILSTDERPGLAPNEKAIAAYVRKYPTSKHPDLPGVVCKKVPAVTQRKA